MTTIPPLTTGEAAVAALIANGIDTHLLPARRAERLPVRRAAWRRGKSAPIHTRHEQGAGYMALGMAMASGKPACLHRGARARLPQHDRGAVTAYAATRRCWRSSARSLRPPSGAATGTCTSQP